MNTTSIAPENISLFDRMAHAFAQRVQAWSDAIDAAPPVDRHRMGAWETDISPCAQAALQVMRARATRRDAAQANSISQASLTSTAPSENG